MIRRFFDWITGNTKQDETPKHRTLVDPNIEAISEYARRERLNRSNDNKPASSRPTARPAFQRRSEAARRRDDSSDYYTNPLHPLHPIHHTSTDDSSSSRHHSSGGGDFGGAGASGSWGSSHSSSDSCSSSSSSYSGGGGSSYDSGGGGGDCGGGGGGGDCTANPYADPSFNRLQRRLGMRFNIA